MLELYRPYVEETTSSLEYKTPSLDEWTTRFLPILSHFPVIVARVNQTGILAGYAYACPFKPRAGYAWTCESTIYLARGKSGSGLGRCMYELLLDAISRMGMVAVVATITSSNFASIDFHRRVGFVVCGVHSRVGFKRDSWLDVVVMQKPLVSAADLPATPIPTSSVTWIESRPIAIFRSRL